MTSAKPNPMGEQPVSKLILKLAVPTILSMLITSIYSSADTYFVSKLGTSATGATGVVFSLMSLIQAMGFMVGMGAASNISRLLGQEDYEQANTLGSTAFFTSLAVGFMITVLGLLFIKPLMLVLGSTQTILPYAISYGSIILLGAPIMCASFVMNQMLRSEGRASFSMIGIVIGGLLNMALDPLLIFFFHMGVAGAALATVLSQCVSFLILLSIYLRKKSSITIHMKYISRSPSLYGTIFKSGFPSFCRQGLGSVSTAVLNLCAGLYGDPCVAAMSIVSRIFMLVYSVLIGFGQGFQPVVGYNYGARKWHRVRDSIIFTIKVSVGFMFVLGLIGFIIAPFLMRLFNTGDASVTDIGITAIRAQALVMPLLPFATISNMTFQMIGKPGASSLLSSARQGIFFFPLILILPQLFGMIGVQITQALADLFTFFMSLFFLIPLLRSLDKDTLARKENE